MKTYQFERQFTVWQRVIVEAKNKEQAKELGDTELGNGGGYLMEETLEPTDETYLEQI
jgi:hypothetical protein